MALNRYGLRSRVIIYSILPILVIGFFFAGNYMFNRYNQLEQSVIDEGMSIIEPMALAIETPYNSDDVTTVKNVIGYVHRKHSDLIESIAIFDTEGNLFATSNFTKDFEKFSYSTDKIVSLYTSIGYADNSIIMRTPIFSEFLSNQYKTWQINRTPGELTIRGYISVKLSTIPTKLSLYSDIAQSVFVILIGLVLALIFAFSLIKEVVEPINRMIKAIYSIKEGQLDTRITGGMYGELDRLRSGINGMAKSIASYHNEMQQNIDQATSDLRETADQLEMQNIELEFAKKQAQEAAKVKTEFLANMSHELRTPLNGVIGFTRQLFKSQLTPTQFDYLSTIEKSAKNLLSIINNILDFSKLEAGKLSFERIPFSIRDTVDETITLIAPTVHEKNVDLSAYIDPSIPYLLMGDPLRLQQVILNLLSNAVKFSEKGSVNVSICKSSRNDELANKNTITIEITVKDTGIGISPSQQQKLFQPFNQANSSISRTFGGTGLGLVITQKLVTLMGGGIFVKSQLGKGSVFTTRIPLELAVMPGERSSSIPQMKDLNVLLIDENEWSRESYKKTMEDWNMNVYALSSPNSVKNLPIKNFFITLLAVKNNQDETELMQWIDMLPNDVPLVVMTNSHDADINVKYLNFGISSYLIKPITSERLLECLNNRKANKNIVVRDSVVKKQEPVRKRSMIALAVDDNSANLKLISTLLSEHITMVDAVDSGSQALELCRTKVYDIIFMDIQMPVMDGITALKHIREDDLSINKKTPVVAVTALAIPGERERLMNQGMNEYIAKPIEESHLMEILDNISNLANIGSKKIQAVKDDFLRDEQPELRDPKLALRYSSGKKELAKEMLEMFLASVPTLQETINKIDTISVDNLIKVVHKSAGGAAYCGMPKIQKICNTIEVELRKGRSIKDLEPELYELDDMLEMIKKQSSAWIEELAN